MHRYAALIATATTGLLLAGCGAGRCYDCGGRMTAPDPTECASPSANMTCTGGRDGCETHVTEKHACVPDGQTLGPTCGGEALTCPRGQVDACTAYLGLNHLCVEIPPQPETAAPVTASEGPALIETSHVDLLLDIDQPREQKPDGDWTEQQYIGPKQYDRLFVALTHDAPAMLVDKPTGPLDTVDHVDLYTGTSTKPLATIAKSDAHAFTYTAEIVQGFEYDGRGPTMDTRETLKLFLGHDVGAYIKDAHPFTVVLRARTKDGALVYETTLTGDEAGDYPTIVPPRPY